MIGYDHKPVRGSRQRRNPAASPAEPPGESWRNAPVVVSILPFDLARLKSASRLRSGSTAKADLSLRSSGQNGSPTTVIGPPASGTHVLDEFWPDALGERVCTQAGTPGTWKQVKPAAVTADPSSGTIPTAYLILNVTPGHIKRHAGGFVSEVPGA